MKALNVETLDDLFKAVKERFSFDTFGEFLKKNNIHFNASTRNTAATNSQAILPHAASRRGIL